MMRCNIVLSGGMCTGKTTLMYRLAKEFGLSLVTDHTTRPMRRGESQGNPYTFISHKDFEKNKDAGLYFEPVYYMGHWYGFLLEPLFTKSPWVIDVIASKWLLFKKTFPNTVGVYLESPTSEDELIRRAKERGDSEEEIKARLSLVESESKLGFDIYVPGDQSLDSVYAIIGNKITR